MRGISAYIEGLAAIRFIVLVGLVGGALQGIPRFFLRAVGGTGPHLAQFVIVGAVISPTRHIPVLLGDRLRPIPKWSPDDAG